jgi:hypothetical protein
MAYGYETYKTNGSVLFSSADSTWTLLYRATANANTSHTFTGVPIMPTRVVTRMMINQVTGDDEAYIHTFSLSGSTLTVTRPSSTDTVETFFMVYGK